MITRAKQGVENYKKHLLEFLKWKFLISAGKYVKDLQEFDLSRMGGKGFREYEDWNSRLKGMELALDLSKEEVAKITNQLLSGLGIEA